MVNDIGQWLTNGRSTGILPDIIERFALFSPSITSPESESDPSQVFIIQLLLTGLDLTGAGRVRRVFERDSITRELSLNTPIRGNVPILGYLRFLGAYLVGFFTTLMVKRVEMRSRVSHCKYTMRLAWCTKMGSIQKMPI